MAESGENREAALRRFVAGARSLAAQKQARQKELKQMQSVDTQSVQSESHSGSASSENENGEPVELCCKGVVHIAYRGIADDRMYMCYSRTWAELRYFRQNGLRVFCADCRVRLI